MFQKNACDTSSSVSIPRTNDATTKEKCSSNKEYYEKYKWRSTICSRLYKQRIENISKETNIRALLNEEYPGHENHNILLIGLHTCGNLAPNCLRLFVDNTEAIKAIINVGCCYHLIDEEFAINSGKHHAKNATVIGLDAGFPMSSYLRNQRFKLGRDARMCGTQNPWKVFKERDVNIFI